MKDLLGDLLPPKVSKRGRRTARNRSVHQFDGDLKLMVESAANEIEWITLFQNPLPDPQQSQEILDKVWREIELKFATDVVRDVKVDGYVCSINLTVVI